MTAASGQTKDGQNKEMKLGEEKVGGRSQSTDESD